MLQPKRRLRKIPIILLLALGAMDLFFTNFHYSPFLPCQPFDSQYEVTNPPKTEELDHILTQRFTYLGCGHQCSAYLSEDGQYVLKLARRLHFRWPSIAQAIPLPRFLGEHRRKIITKQQRQLSIFFLSTKLSYEQLRDECGLIYVHLNPSDSFHISLKIRDRFLRPFTLDLDRQVFIIQKKMRPITDALDEYRRNQETKKIRTLIGNLVKSLANTMRKGLIDTDRSHFKNYGILGDGIACFDTGNIRKDSQLQFKDHFTISLQKTLKNTRRWIATDFPEELSFFDQKLSEEL